MRRTSGKTIPQLLVREEEPFVELQRALQRARAERAKVPKPVKITACQSSWNASW